MPQVAVEYSQPVLPVPVTQRLPARALVVPAAAVQPVSAQQAQPLPGPLKQIGHSMARLGRYFPRTESPQQLLAY